jgi:AcrR family transcriptional regulator
MAMRKPADERREEIVDAALALADQAGPDRLTTAAVAEAVGITQAAIFRHFPKKQDLWDAVAATIARRMEAQWAEALAGGGCSRERLTHLVRAQLMLVQGTPAIPAILFSRELHADNDALRSAFMRLMGRFADHLAAIVDEGGTDGTFRADLDPREAAFAVIAVMQGVIVRWSLSGRAFDLRGESERLLAVAMRGLLPAGGDRS